MHWFETAFEHSASKPGKFLLLKKLKRWYQHDIAQKRSEMSNRPCPRVLGIDEHFFTRRQGYATTFVDLKNHKVFDVKLGRSESSLRGYLRSIEGRDKVQVVVMDLSETYRSIARRYFPNATIVADRFHVVRLINWHFLKIWNSMMKREEKTGA